jgi:ferredoxin
MGRSLKYVEKLRASFPDRFRVARSMHKQPWHWLAKKLYFDGDDLVVLPSDRIVTVDRNIADPGQAVLPSLIVEHFINEAEYHWIMNTCICRHASNCKDYPIDLGCMFLGKSVLGINPELGRRVNKQEALEHARKCREAGLVHMVGRNKLDKVWLGVSPGNRLLTICNCCPCCCLWKWMPDIPTDIGRVVHKLPGIEVIVGETCTSCGVCADGVCFVNAISVVNGSAVISGECRGCGRCAGACPVGAIKIKYDESAVQKSIDTIEALVDVC